MFKVYTFVVANRSTGHSLHVENIDTIFVFQIADACQNVRIDDDRSNVQW